MQSPSSSGLLPASYSRRRRSSRPKGSLVEGTNDGAGASWYRTIEPAHGDTDHTGSNPRRSLSTKPLYTLASHDENKSAESLENEENDKRRSNARTDVFGEDNEDVLDKPPKLSDFVINDRCYERYLLEGKRDRFMGINSKKTAPGSSGKGFIGPSFLAKFCAGWSFVGMIFLVFAAIVLETQPLFVKGISIKSRNRDDETYRFSIETSNALKAAAAYFLVMVFSLIYLQAMEMNLELNPAIGRLCHLRRLVVSTYLVYRRRQYDDIPDGDSSFGIASGLVLPMHNNDQEKYLKSHRRRKRKTRRKNARDHGDSSEGTVEGVIGRIKSWGVGGGLPSKGRKKDK